MKAEEIENKRKLTGLSEILYLEQNYYENVDNAVVSLTPLKDLDIFEENYDKITTEIESYNGFQLIEKRKVIPTQILQVSSSSSNEFNSFKKYWRNPGEQNIFKMDFDWNLMELELGNSNFNKELETHLQNTFLEDEFASKQEISRRKEAIELVLIDKGIISPFQQDTTSDNENMEISSSLTPFKRKFSDIVDN